MERYEGRVEKHVDERQERAASSKRDGTRELSGGEMVVTWWGASSAGKYDVSFWVSADGGRGDVRWREPVELKNDTGEDAT